MRLPFPERIPLLYAFAFAVILGVVEMMQGTELYFVCGVALFLILATLAFNTAGGFSRPSGAYVFFNALLTLTIGVVYKAWLGEPAQSNLLAPQTTIMVYDLGMTSMLAATYISRRFASREGWLQNALPLNRMQSAVYGCIGLGLLTSLANAFIGSGGSGSFLSAFNQLDKFMMMGILLGVTHQVRKTGGRSVLSFAVIFACSWIIITGGIFTYSKEALLGPVAAVLLTAASLGYRFTWKQLAVITFGAFFFFYYLVPYSQIGRTYREYDITWGQQLSRSADLLTRLPELRTAYKETESVNFEASVVHYYDTPQGFWDRLEMLAIDDGLIHYTETQRTFGYYPLIFGVENIVPHFLWKDKPTYVWGNIYAHEIGMLTEGDFSTGVSFSPVGEAWHLGRWVSLMLITPLLWSIFFVVFDSLAGDVRKSPWGLLAIVLFIHIASEGGVNSLIYELAYGVASLLLVAFFSARIVPHLGALIIGPGRTTAERGSVVSSIERRGSITG